MSGIVGMAAAALAIGAFLVLAAEAVANSGTAVIGRTWPIAEPDAMAEIEARASALPPSMADTFGPRPGWSAMQAARLGRATEDRTRSVVPLYTLDTEIRLPDGKLLYPRGFTINPLSYVSLQQRLVIVHPRDLGWAVKTASLTDWILLTAGGGAQEDALSLGEKHGRAVFILEERVKERLGLTVAPVIVRQVGQKLELTEIGPKGRGAPQEKHP